MSFLLQASRACAPLRLGRDPEIEQILFDQEVDEAFSLDESDIQSSCSVLNVRKARKLATLFVSETGELLVNKIRSAKAILEAYPHTIGYGCEEERKRDRHFLKALTFLIENVEAQRLIRKMSRPVTNRLAETAIRDTLLLPEQTVVNDAQARQAVIAALLTTLRQSLGSCFATAPAIIVQEEQPLRFLKDLDELIGSAKLRRIVAGNEYSVPMSSSWGQGDVKKPLVFSSPLEKSVPIWRSLPLLRALKAAALLEEAATSQTLFQLIERVYGPLLKEMPYVISSVDELTKQFVMKHLGLSEAALQEYMSRPKPMFQTALVMTTQKSTGERASQEKLFQQFFALCSDIKRRYKAEADCALLKTWEFTIASFAEVKFDLARWNFYSSLGINYDDVGGIGQVLYEIAKKRVDETNQDLEEHRQKYDAISLEVDYLARRMQQASTESEIQFLKMEYQSRQVEQYNIQQLCDMAAEKANKVANIHQFLIDQYDRLMKEYFQEIYDADLHDVQAGPFDDSPAGFRLLYKHGRSNPSLWTKITSLDEYIDALVSFFTITEQELLHAPEVKGIESEFTSIITRLATHVRSDEFLESAFARTAIAHGVRPIEKPLLNLDRIEKKPWVYTSGGSMNTLVSAYFCVEGQPEVVERWVENETELLAYLIDTTRQGMGRAGRYRPSSILMHSPTHAFSLLPFGHPFEEGWSGDSYSYSWVANNVRDPGLSFYSSCVLDSAAVNQFCQDLAASLPESIRTRFVNEAPTIPGFLRPFDLGKEIERLFELDIVLRHHTNVLRELSLDSRLYESVPYTAPDALHETIMAVLTAMFPKEAKRSGAEHVRRAVGSIYRPLRSRELLELVKTIIILMFGRCRFEKDVLETLLSVMRDMRLLPPKPLIFADSNWVKDFFAFVIGPTSQQLEFWSVNAYGTQGRPITNWKMWLDGSRKDKKWGVLINPNEYR